MSIEIKEANWFYTEQSRIDIVLTHYTGAEDKISNSVKRASLFIS